MTWNKVAEAMPIFRDEVIIFGRFESSPQKFVAAGYACKTHAVGEGVEWRSFYNDSAGDEIAMIDVTHWMPMPQPPIE